MKAQVEDIFVQRAMFATHNMMSGSRGLGPIERKPWTLKMLYAMLRISKVASEIHVRTEGNVSQKGRKVLHRSVIACTILLLIRVLGGKEKRKRRLFVDPIKNVARLARRLMEKKQEFSATRVSKSMA